MYEEMQSNHRVSILSNLVVVQPIYLFANFKFIHLKNKIGISYKTMHIFSSPEPKAQKVSL